MCFISQELLMISYLDFKESMREKWDTASSVLDINENVIYYEAVDVCKWECHWSTSILLWSSMIFEEQISMLKAIFCSWDAMSEGFVVLFSHLTYAFWSFYNYSLLLVISLYDMIDCMIVEDTFNTRLFIKFIHDLLNKMNSFSTSRFIIIMNNYSIHKALKICQLIKSRSAFSSSFVLF